MGYVTETQARCFCALATHKNFHRASKAIGIRQPTLTRAVKTLEHHLRVALFERLPVKRGHTVRLTDAGWILQPRFERLASTIREIRDVVKDVQEGHRQAQEKQGAAA